MFLHLCVLLCVFVVGAMTASSYNYDFFFPGTDFLLNLEGCDPQNGNLCDVYLLLNNTDITAKDDNHPQTKFKLAAGTFDGSYILNDISNLPDGLDMGIYPNATFEIVHAPSAEFTEETIELVADFTFYKSQTFMDSELRSVQVGHSGVYSPSLESVNYRTDADVNTSFNYVGPAAGTQAFVLNYLGVKACDHFAIYDGTRNDKVLAIPTIFNRLSDKEAGKGTTSYSLGRNTEGFQTQFATTDAFTYESYAPTLRYLSQNGQYDYTPEDNFIDLSWTLENVDNEEPEVDEEGITHFGRGDSIEITASLVLSDYFYDIAREINADKTTGTLNNMYVLFAMCHIDRPGDVWSYIDSNVCTEAAYVAAPPYKCVISAEYNLAQTEGEDPMTYTHSESTQMISLVDLLTEPDTGAPGEPHRFDLTMSFETGEVNPIPFRIVPLLGVIQTPEDPEAQDPNIVSYAFVPLGPASPIYEIDLDVIPALIFFIIVFVVITALCIIAYFGGMAIHKCLKEKKAKKGAEHKPLAEQSEGSNVSMVDSSYGTESSPAERKKEASEKDKLIDDHSSYSSNDKEKRIA